MPMYKEAVEQLDYDIDFDSLKNHLLKELDELYC